MQKTRMEPPFVSLKRNVLQTILGVYIVKASGDGFGGQLAVSTTHLLLFLNLTDEIKTQLTLRVLLQ